VIPLKLRISVILLVLSIGLISFVGVSSPSSYRIEGNYIYATGIGKPKSNSDSLASVKRAARDNVKSAILRAVYENNIETPYVTNVRKEKVGLLSFLGIGKTVIQGEVSRAGLEVISFKSYYQGDEVRIENLIKVVRKVRMSIEVD